MTARTADHRMTEGPLRETCTSAPAPNDLDYITADLCGNAPGLTFAELKRRRHWPAGKRGYLVIALGEQWTTLLSPVSLKTFKLPTDEFDAWPRTESRDFDPVAMLARIGESRDFKRKHGLFDGGRAADKAETMLRAWIATAKGAAA